jgi:hypothetical protein
MKHMPLKPPRVEPGGVVRYVDKRGCLSRALKLWDSGWLVVSLDKPQGSVVVPPIVGGHLDTVTDDELLNDCGPSGFFRELDGLA